MLDAHLDRVRMQLASRKIIVVRSILDFHPNAIITENKKNVSWCQTSPKNKCVLQNFRVQFEKWNLIRSKYGLIVVLNSVYDW